MDEAKIVEMVKKEVSEWFASQNDQTDGYQYEKSFVDCWRIIGNKVLQDSIGEIPVSKNKKKTSKQFRTPDSTQSTSDKSNVKYLSHDILFTG